MASLETKKMIQKFIGLESIGTDRQRRYLKILVPICVSVSLLSTSLSIGLGLILNENENIGKSSLSISGFLGLLIGLSIYWHLLINHERINSLLDDMRDIVNDDCEYIVLM